MSCLTFSCGLVTNGTVRHGKPVLLIRHFAKYDECMTYICVQTISVVWEMFSIVSFN